MHWATILICTIVFATVAIAIAGEDTSVEWKVEGECDVTIDSNANSRLKRHTLRGFSMPAIIPCFPFLSSCQFDLPWIPNPLTTNALPAKLTPNVIKSQLCAEKKCGQTCGVSPFGLRYCVKSQRSNGLSCVLQPKPPTCADNQLSENKKLIINYPDEFKNNEFDEDKIPFNGHPNVTKSHPKISCRSIGNNDSGHQLRSSPFNVTWNRKNISGLSHSAWSFGYVKGADCSTDADCNTQNCFYCLSSGKCGYYASDYCDSNECGTGDGGCKPGTCNTGKTCGKNNFLGHHPDLCHCEGTKEADVCIPGERSYHNLGNVAYSEGNSVGDTLGTTLDQCKELCDLNTNCNSFAFAAHAGVCHQKDKCISMSEPTKVVTGYLTYFKVCDQSWINLGNVAYSEGNSVGDTLGTTLDQCKELCDLNTNCNSFAFAAHTGACHQKDKCITPNEQTKIGGGYFTYFKHCH